MLNSTLLTIFMSSVPVVNGSAVNPPVDQIVSLRTNGMVLCTGVFVGKNPPTLLTAAHCANGYVETTSSVRWSSSTLVKGDGNYPSSKDLAIVVFAGQTLPFEPYAVAQGTVRRGAQVKIIGWGSTSFTGLSGLYTQRIGVNTVSGVLPSDTVYADNQGHAYSQMYMVAPALNDEGGGAAVSNLAVSGDGDSGGPIFIGNQVAGIVSGSLDDAQLINHYMLAHAVNLSGPDAQELMHRAVTSIGADIRGLQAAASVAAMDADGDGVSNTQDLCTGSAAGATVETTAGSARLGCAAGETTDDEHLAGCLQAAERKPECETAVP